jgi:hypothetical protein
LSPRGELGGGAWVELFQFGVIARQRRTQVLDGSRIGEFHSTHCDSASTRVQSNRQTTYAEDTEMAKPPLSMKPTGWFQVAWSAEISIGDVHRMTYFGQEMVAWRC